MIFRMCREIYVLLKSKTVQAGSKIIDECIGSFVYMYVEITQQNYVLKEGT